MVKNLPTTAGDTRDVGLIPETGRSPGGGNGNPAPVFLPRKFHGQRSLEGYSLWGHKELDTTENEPPKAWRKEIACLRNNKETVLAKS